VEEVGRQLREEHRREGMEPPTIPPDRADCSHRSEVHPSGVTDVPDRVSVDQEDDKVVQDFRRLVGSRLGELGVAVLDARLADEQKQRA